MTDISSALIECSRIWAEAWVETARVEAAWAYGTGTACALVFFGLCAWTFYHFVVAPERRTWRRQDAEDARNEEEEA